MKHTSNRYSGIVRIVLCLALTVALLGCIRPERRSISKRELLLDVQRARQEAESPGRGIVEIQRFGISSRFEGKGLIYRISDVTYESDFYNEYLTSPQSMVTEEVSNWLTRSGIFDSVVYTDSNLNANFILEGTVLALYGDFTQPENPRAVVEIEFFLIDDQNQAPSKLFGRVYRATEPVASRRAEDLIRAQNACLESILTRMEADLRSTVTKYYE